TTGALITSPTCHARNSYMGRDHGMRAAMRSKAGARASPRAPGLRDDIAFRRGLARDARPAIQGPVAAPTLHYARTRDGWQLALHHRPPARGGHGTPLLLCHGMGSNRFNMDGPGRASLARHLQAAGFDVWVLELRG